MRLAQAIAQYVDFRKSLGTKFENNAKLLRSFSRAIGEETELSVVREDRVKAFLDGRGPLTSFWHSKHAALCGFYRYAVTRGYATCVPLPTIIPKEPARFVPYIYSRVELQRLLDATSCYQ